MREPDRGDVALNGEAGDVVEGGVREAVRARPLPAGPTVLLSDYLLNILILNDGRNQDHFGPHFVMEALVDRFDPVRTLPVFSQPSSSTFDGIDFVIVNAEGSTHRNRNPHLYADYGIPSAMINAVWQHNATPDLGHFDYISTRESLSAEAMKSCGVRATVVPDLMLLKELEPQKGGGLVISDSTVLHGGGVPPARGNLDIFLRADRLVCGRFHVACLAIMTGKPFSCYPSNTHKIEGMMLDARLAPVLPDRAKALDRCPRRPNPNAAAYLKSARKKIRTMLDDVEALICES